LTGVFVCVVGNTPTTVRIVKTEYKLFGVFTPEEVENEDLPEFDTTTCDSPRKDDHVVETHRVPIFR
jgi:hypothetical protein